MEGSYRPETVLNIDELRFGKPVRSRSGPIAPDAEYGITASTAGVTDPLTLLPAKLLDGAALTPSKIDPQFTGRGALVVVAVEAGLAAMRLRFRPEAGEAAGGREYVLSTTVLLPGVEYWADIPPGFFAWCERELEAEAHLRDEASELSARRMSLPKWWHRGKAWFNALPDWRQIQVGSAFFAITNGMGWLAAHAPAHSGEERLGQLLAGDLDFLASLELDIPLRRRDGSGGYVFAMGIDPVLTPGAISFVAARQGMPIEAPDLDSLRRAVDRVMNAEVVASSPGRIQIFDSLGRSIGREPITLPSL
jgi:hypothetical protein